MNRNVRMAEARDFYDVLASELRSHIDNGSEFLWYDRDGEPVSDEVRALREGILLRLAASLERKAGRR